MLRAKLRVIVLLEKVPSCLGLNMIVIADVCSGSRRSVRGMTEKCACLEASISKDNCRELFVMFMVCSDCVPTAQVSKERVVWETENVGDIALAVTVKL